MLLIPTCWCYGHEGYLKTWRKCAIRFYSFSNVLATMKSTVKSWHIHHLNVLQNMSKNIQSAQSCTDTNLMFRKKGRIFRICYKTYCYHATVKFPVLLKSQLSYIEYHLLNVHLLHFNSSA